jgi:hypothetical protein
VVSVPLCEVEVGVASTTGDPERDENRRRGHNSQFCKGHRRNIWAIRLWVIKHSLHMAKRVRNDLRAVRTSHV